ncbi:MAG: hypothetical protein H5U40_03220, partial [Polyangiaceae bacterium]|nr:hypothetical protein [Polyangiaceae bacterium]
PGDDSTCHFTNDAAGVAQAQEFVFRYNLESGGFVVDNAVVGQPMSCDATSRTCQIDCRNASNCPGGYVCANPVSGSLDCNGGGCICTNPTCTFSSGGGSTPTPTPTPDAGI